MISKKDLYPLHLLREQREVQHLLCLHPQYQHTVFHWVVRTLWTSRFEWEEELGIWGRVLSTHILLAGMRPVAWTQTDMRGVMTDAMTDGT